MLLADSSVLIDFFNAIDTPQTRVFTMAVQTSVVFIADLVLVEVLEGFGDDREFDRARRVFEGFEPITASDPPTALLAAQYYRQLQRLGRTPRKTIDTLIATRCIVDRIPLLFSDRDYLPFVEHCGLIDALAA